MRVAVGIKALNEEKNIAKAISSSLHALRNFDGEVILADSGSSDDTIAIARKFPIKIFQLKEPSERCCGAGAQLAFQHARADYFYLLDGDMILDANFLAAGVSYLEANTDVAAVGGRVREINTDAAEFAIRSQKLDQDSNWRPGPVDRLDCGGLYRTAAIRDVGYFADRNLHSFEEFELGARLRQRGWKLVRIDHPAVDHFGHTSQSYRLLWRRLRSGYMGGSGEVLRSALGRAHFSIVISQLTQIVIAAVVVAWWFSIALSMALFPWAVVGLMLIPLVLLAFRRRSASLGLFSLLSWNAAAVGTIAGFFKQRKRPGDMIASVEVSSGIA